MDILHSAEQIETLATREGPLFALDMGISTIMLEGDFYHILTAMAK